MKIKLVLDDFREVLEICRKSLLKQLIILVLKKTCHPIKCSEWFLPYQLQCIFSVHRQNDPVFDMLERILFETTYIAFR